MSEKMACDLCGNDAGDTEFILPRYEDWVNTIDGENVVRYCAGIKPHKFHLCADCMMNIAGWIYKFQKY